MEGFFQVVIFLVIVVASIWSEVSKNKSSGSTDAEFGDLTAIDDFFKQQEKSRKPDQPQAPVAGFDNDAISLERSFDAGSASSRRVQPQGEPIARKKKEKKQGKGRERAALDQKGRPLPPTPRPSSHFGNVDSDEGPCLDDAPSLFGKPSYEREGTGIARSASTTDMSSRKPVRRWSRQQLISSIIISELMNRYDVNRVFARIPDRRS